MEGTLSNRLTPLQTLRRHPYLILAFCCLLVHAASCISGADPLPADMLLMIVCLMAGGFLLYGLSRPAGTGRRIPLIVSLGGIPVSYTHLDVYKRQFVQRFNKHKNFLPAVLPLAAIRLLVLSSMYSLVSCRLCLKLRQGFQHEFPRNCIW